MISIRIAVLAFCLAVAPHASASEPARADRCATRFETGAAVTGLSFVSVGAPQPKRFIAVAHGNEGLSIRRSDGAVAWTDGGRADLVSAYGETLIVYRRRGAGDEIVRFRIDETGKGAPSSFESPAEIAPTTLQRNAYAALGPVRIGPGGVTAGDAFIASERPVAALAATRAPFGRRLGNGAVAFAFDDGSVALCPLSIAGR